ncbi:MAG TPA: dienelactone hydrolase family protein [Methylibium sp.]|uniref:dienelactone hydrolase family protein n=1 Tax=Methylibium sp. TaxID=2067992 RepID=UPI002DBD51C1|nr:dienelactone hydrolase family protein [Methylibium sp.]HEU4458577.1 dienelactone hydrolase family protein [Methylibium sp.]
MLKQELDSLTPTRPFNRRDFVATSIGSGFAAAVLPVSAQTITTSSEGLTAGPIEFAAGDRSIPAYRAQPAQPAGKLPVVLVISEIFGVHEHIADVARRFAKQGYLAIAPEMFVRQGDAKAYTDIPKLMAEVVSKKPDTQALSDLDAAVTWAAANGGDTARLGATGFCWGGRITWLYSAHNPRLKAGVAWYGRLVGDANAMTPKQPVDLAGSLNAPVLGLYGEKDGGIPLDTVDKMKTALASGNVAAKASNFVVYPDAPHAFHADYRPSYRKDAAEDGWKRCLAWFRAWGVA